MPALGPRETEPDAWIRWHKEAVALLVRRPVPVIAWLAVCVVLFYIGNRTSWQPLRAASVLFLVPLSLMAFIRVAWCADYSRRAGIWEITPTNRDCMLAIGVAAVLFAVGGALSPMLQSFADTFRELVEALGLYSPILADGDLAPDPLRYTLLGPFLVIGGVVGLAVSACLVFLIAFGQWFALPMLVLHQTPLPPSMASSARAYQINPVPMLGLAGVMLITLLLVMATLGWVSLVMIPFFGALLYTSYRDVFLGREENQPAAAIEGTEEVSPQESGI